MNDLQKVVHALWIWCSFITAFLAIIFERLRKVEKALLAGKENHDHTEA